MRFLVKLTAIELFETNIPDHFHGADIPVEQCPASCFEYRTSNLRQKNFKVTADSLKIDTVSIIPNTFSITSVPASDYRLDFVKAVLHWIKKPVC